MSMQNQYTMSCLQPVLQPIMQMTALLCSLPSQRFSCTIKRIKVIAVGKKEITHRLERHLAQGLSQQACHCAIPGDTSVN